MPTVAATICAACTASGRTASSTAITAISAMLNNSGENAVSAKRPCAFNSAIITVTGPAKARYGSISRALSVASCSVSRPENPGASAVITSGITSASTAVAAINAVVTVPSTRPANAAAATAPSVSRTRSHAGTSAAFSPPSVNSRRIDIDQLKRRQERIRDGARAEQRGQRRIAHESKQPRGQRSRGYREKGADHWRVL